MAISINLSRHNHSEKILKQQTSKNDHFVKIEFIGSCALLIIFFVFFSLGLLKTRDTKSGVRDRAIFFPHSLNTWPNGLFMLISGVLRKLLGILMLILSVFTFFCANFFEAEITLVLTLMLFSYLLKTKAKLSMKRHRPSDKVPKQKVWGKLWACPYPFPTMCTGVQFIWIIRIFIRRNE